VDWQWLNACLGVVENNYSAVEAYLSCGGNPARSLTVRQDEGAGDQWLAERLACLLQPKQSGGATTATAKRGHRQREQLIQ